MWQIKLGRIKFLLYQFIHIYIKIIFCYSPDSTTLCNIHYCPPNNTYHIYLDINTHTKLCSYNMENKTPTGHQTSISALQMCIDWWQLLQINDRFTECRMECTTKKTTSNRFQERLASMREAVHDVCMLQYVIFCLSIVAALTELLLTTAWIATVIACLYTLQSSQHID